MIKVLVYGEDTDSTGVQLYEALSAVFRITYISGTRFYDCGGTPELLLVESNRKFQCNFEDGIVRKYSYTVYLPNNCKDFAIGDRVRISLLGEVKREFEVKGFHRWQHQCKIWV